VIILFQKFLWYKTLAAPIFAPGFSIEFNIVSAITGRLEMFLAIHQRLDVVQGFAEALIRSKGLRQQDLSRIIQESQ
jgi:hypothetical protein